MSAFYILSLGRMSLIEKNNKNPFGVYVLYKYMQSKFEKKQASSFLASCGVSKVYTLLSVNTMVLSRIVRAPSLRFMCLGDLMSLVDNRNFTWGQWIMEMVSQKSRCLLYLLSPSVLWSVFLFPPGRLPSSSCAQVGTLLYLSEPIQIPLPSWSFIWLR